MEDVQAGLFDKCFLSWRKQLDFGLSFQVSQSRPGWHLWCWWIWVSPLWDRCPFWCNLFMLFATRIVFRTATFKQGLRYSGSVQHQDLQVQATRLQFNNLDVFDVRISCCKVCFEHNLFVSYFGFDSSPLRPFAIFSPAEPHQGGCWCLCPPGHGFSAASSTYRARDLVEFGRKSKQNKRRRNTDEEAWKNEKRLKSNFLASLSFIAFAWSRKAL